MSKQARTFQKSVSGEGYIVSKEILEQQALELPSSAIKQLRPPREKKPRSEAQLAALENLKKAAKERVERLRAAKQAILEEEKKQLPVIEEADKKIVEQVLKPALKEKRVEQKKAKEEELLAAGSHIRVIVKPRRTRKKKVETETEDTTDDTTDYTETEDDTDLEDYKAKSRQVRRAAVAKKLVKTVEKIDRVIQQAAPANPYANMLASKWR